MARVYATSIFGILLDAALRLRAAACTTAGAGIKVGME
jgi:hypothetical protein